MQLSTYSFIFHVPKHNRPFPVLIKRKEELGELHWFLDVKDTFILRTGNSAIVNQENYNDWSSKGPINDGFFGTS